MPVAIDSTGVRFGRLVALECVGRSGPHRVYRCACDCGAVVDVRHGDLRNGRSQSCGCRKNALTSERFATHGESGGSRETSAEYRVWKGMINRCECSTSTGFAKYGALGVSVCTRWRESFADFLADMGRRPSDDHSIDRIDPFGNYEPSNCRWATRSEQARNKRRSGTAQHGARAHG